MPEQLLLSTPDGADLFARRWSIARPLGHVVLVHGLGEHSGRYEAFGEQLAQAGYEVLAYDQRGYGRSPRRRWPRYSQLLDDLDFVLREAGNDGSPPFLLGQSFGGNLILNLALRRSPSIVGLVAASPLLRLARPPAPWKQQALRGVARVWPNFTVRTGIRPEQLTESQPLQQKFRSDPLIRRRVPLQLAASMIDSGEWAAGRGEQLAIPSLLLHGDADEVTCFQSSRQFAAASTNCDFHPIVQGRHELLHSDVDNTNRIIEWMEQCRGSRNDPSN